MSNKRCNWKDSEDGYGWYNHLKPSHHNFGPYDLCELKHKKYPKWHSNSLNYPPFGHRQLSIFIPINNDDGAEKLV